MALPYLIEVACVLKNIKLLFFCFSKFGICLIFRTFVANILKLATL
jgi:hypothetical protein